MPRQPAPTDVSLPMLAAAPWLLGMAAFSECLTLFAWHPHRPAQLAATHDLPVPEPLEAAEMPELFA
jgi:hypothetical protein